MLNKHPKPTRNVKRKRNAVDLLSLISNLKHRRFLDFYETPIPRGIKTDFPESIPDEYKNLKFNQDSVDIAYFILRLPEIHNNTKKESDEIKQFYKDTMSYFRMLKVFQDCEKLLVEVTINGCKQAIQQKVINEITRCSSEVTPEHVFSILTNNTKIRELPRISDKIYKIENLIDFGLYDDYPTTYPKLKFSENYFSIRQENLQSFKNTLIKQKNQPDKQLNSILKMLLVSQCRYGKKNGKNTNIIQPPFSYFLFKNLLEKNLENFDYKTCRHINYIRLLVNSENGGNIRQHGDILYQLKNPRNNVCHHVCITKQQLEEFQIFLNKHSNKLSQYDHEKVNDWLSILEITNLDNCNKSYGDHLTITIPQKTFDWELYEVFAFKPEKSKKKMDRNFFIEKMSQSIEYAKYLMKTFTTLKDNFLSGFIQSYNRNKNVANSYTNNNGANERDDDAELGVRQLYLLDQQSFKTHIKKFTKSMIFLHKNKLSHDKIGKLPSDENTLDSDIFHNLEGKDEENKKVVRKIIYTFLTAKLNKTHSIAVMNVTGELEGELQRELKVTGEYGLAFYENETLKFINQLDRFRLNELQYSTRIANYFKDEVVLIPKFKDVQALKLKLTFTEQILGTGLDETSGQNNTHIKSEVLNKYIEENCSTELEGYQIRQLKDLEKIRQFVFKEGGINYKTEYTTSTGVGYCIETINKVLDIYQSLAEENPFNHSCQKLGNIRKSVLAVWRLNHFHLNLHVTNPSLVKEDTDAMMKALVKLNEHEFKKLAKDYFFILGVKTGINAAENHEVEKRNHLKFLEEQKIKFQQELAKKLKSEEINRKSVENSNFFDRVKTNNNGGSQSWRNNESSNSKNNEPYRPSNTTDTERYQLPYNKFNKGNNAWKHSQQFQPQQKKSYARESNRGWDQAGNNSRWRDNQAGSSTGWNDNQVGNRRRNDNSAFRRRNDNSASQTSYRRYDPSQQNYFSESNRSNNWSNNSGNGKRWNSASQTSYSRHDAKSNADDDNNWRDKNKKGGNQQNPSKGIALKNRKRKASHLHETSAKKSKLDVLARKIEKYERIIRSLDELIEASTKQN